MSSAPLEVNRWPSPSGSLANSLAKSNEAGAPHLKGQRR